MLPALLVSLSPCVAHESGGCEKPDTNVTRLPESDLLSHRQRAIGEAPDFDPGHHLCRDCRGGGFPGIRVAPKPPSTRAVAAGRPPLPPCGRPLSRRWPPATPPLLLHPAFGYTPTSHTYTISSSAQKLADGSSGCFHLRPAGAFEQAVGSPMSTPDQVRTGRTGGRQRLTSQAVVAARPGAAHRTKSRWRDGGG